MSITLEKAAVLWGNFGSKWLANLTSAWKANGWITRLMGLPSIYFVVQKSVHGWVMGLMELSRKYFVVQKSVHGW